MKAKFLNLLRVAASVAGIAIAAAMFFLPVGKTPAQTVTPLPSFVAPRAVNDLGNGPTEVRMLSGNMGLFTSSGTGTGSTSGSSTALTLVATPTTLLAPCIGCVLSGTGITSGTTVISYAPGTGTVGMSAAMTVAAATPVAWGVACPAAPPLTPQALVQAGVGADVPLYTQARVCASGNTGPGGQYLQFTIGAH